MNFIFDLFAVPLGYVLWFIYGLVGNYFIAIFLFTLLVRALTFPLSLKSQKSQADRARLAPRLERIQKKYAQDRQKLATKQQELYEKEGVSMTGGCLPMVVQMIVLMGIISVIYSPLTHLAHTPTAVINACVDAMQNPLKDDGKTENTDAGKLPRNLFVGYYKELQMMKNLEEYEADVKANMVDKAEITPEEANKYYNEFIDMKSQFNFFGGTLLDTPWKSGFSDISILWLIPLISGLTALASSMISMHYTKAMMSKDQPGQGCSNNMMMIFMPMFSLFITFTVPGGVGIYWICSNLIAILQTVILNHIYNPAKIRLQAEQEYEARRKEKAENKKRLAEARRKEEEDRIRLEKEEAAAAEKARLEAANANKKPVQATKNPNKLKKKEAQQDKVGVDSQPDEAENKEPDSDGGKDEPSDEKKTDAQTETADFGPEGKQ